MGRAHHRRGARHRQGRVRWQLHPASPAFCARRARARHRGDVADEDAAVRRATPRISCSSKPASTRCAFAPISPRPRPRPPARGPRARTSLWAHAAAVSEHSDLGARVELDEISGTACIGVRLIDYRYRFSESAGDRRVRSVPRATDLATPAYGFYYGLGLQWRDLLPHVDAGSGRALLRQRRARSSAAERPADVRVRTASTTFSAACCRSPITSEAPRRAAQRAPAGRTVASSFSTAGGAAWPPAGSCTAGASCSASFLPSSTPH